MRLKNLIAALGVVCQFAAPNSNGAETSADIRTFNATGVVVELPVDNKSVVIRHEAISNYMAAMTMPFPVKEPAEAMALQVGDKISFQLHVTENESWIDGITRRGTVKLPVNAVKPLAETPASQPHHPLLDYKFTNELGQAVSLGDFHGRALAITFFYTRCPLPEYCPRLSKNFQEASLKLEAMPGAPTNWTFLSISLDPEFDTPAMLKAYGQSYQYNPKHWSLLTGPADKISELARQSGVNYTFEDGTINHNFRTLIVDASGHLQMIFPTGGDLSDQIVAEILKATAAPGPPAQSK